MPFRRPTRWLIRGLILAVLAVFGCGVWYAQSWVSPEQVHAAVTASLGEEFQGSNVQVGSARLSVFGGITVTDLTVTWPGDSTPFFIAPHAVIAHDKERLNHGRIAVRKIELEHPTLRIECTADGKWKLPGLDHDTSSDRSVPTFVIRDATVTIIDHRPGGIPKIDVQKAKLQLVNDPHSILKVQGQATVAPFGEVSVSAQFNRDTRESVLRVEMPDVTIGPAFNGEVAKVKPDIAEMLEKVRAKATLKAEVTYQPQAAVAFKPDIKLDIREGTFDDPMLPWPAENVSASIRLADGKVRVEKALAKVGPSQIELNFETKALPALSPGQTVPVAAANPNPDLLGSIEDSMTGVSATVRNLPLSEELFNRLPARAQEARTRLNPVGSVDVSYKFSRSAAGWKRELELHPNKLAFTYAKFRYPVTDLEGTIKKTVIPDGTDEVAIRLNGLASGKRVDFVGRMAGNGDDPLIDLRITGDDLPIDDVLFDSMHKEKYRTMLKRLRGKGRGEFTATIHQDPGINRLTTDFIITVKDGQLMPEQFPYPLEKVRGRVAVRVISSDASRPNAPGTYKPSEPDPDRVDISKFEAFHGTGQVWLDGVNETIPGTRDRKMVFNVKAKNCLLDESLATAIDSIHLGTIWRTFQPKGMITLGMEVTIADRVGLLNADGTVGQDPPFDPNRDLNLRVNFKGPTITPDFFPYEFSELTGAFRYEDNGVDLLDFEANHGMSKVKLENGKVRFRPDGTVWTDFKSISASPFISDQSFRTALPSALKKAVTDLNPRGRMDLFLNQLTVLVPPNGQVKLPEPQSFPSPFGPVGQKKNNPDNRIARGQSPESVETKRYADPLVYWDGQVKFLGAAINTGTTIEDMYGVAACRGRYDTDRLVGALGNAWIETGMIAKQPVSKVKISYSADAQTTDPQRPGTLLPIQMRFYDLHGQLFRGEVGGEARVVLSEPPRYRLLLSAQNVRLEDVAAHYQVGKETDFSGLAQAKMLLEFEPDPKTGIVSLQGGGSVDVPQGRMYKLPVMLELIKVAKLQTPDQTGFEEAHATFRVRGDRIYVDKLDLLGSAVSLGGSGELDMDAKDVKFEFYTIWSQTLKRWLTTPLGDPTSALSDKLFRIEATRTPNGEFKFTPRVVPVVTDPFRAIADRVRNRTGLQSPSVNPTARAVGQ